MTSKGKKAQAIGSQLSFTNAIMQSIYYLGLLGIQLTLFEQNHFSPLMRPLFHVF
jgi:hypothetical protein